MGVSVQHLVDELRSRVASSSASLVAPGRSETVLHSATHDSRQVADLGSGSLFCCVSGERFDGHLFAAQAVADGASALLVERRVDVDVPQIRVESVRLAMGHAASIVHGDPARSLRLIGVTGTNGKTTTAHMLEAVLRAAGRQPAVIGTLTQTRTTPESTDLHAKLADLRADGRSDVVMEVTSHALELHRVDGCRFSVSAFTNLSQDHLDFHLTMEAYFRAKAKLFVPEFTDEAVVNVDDRYGRLLLDSAVVPTTGVQLADVSDLVLHATGSSFVWDGLAITLALAGEFNVRNAITVAAMARKLGIADAAIVEGLAHAVVPGRYEPVRAGQNFGVIVDFAHTPDGLLRVLQAARTTLRSGSKLITVFGCGGDRDRGKRPQMGAAAAMNSDAVIVTSDNPRSEVPSAILDDIIAGIDHRETVQVIEDRRAAIEAALRMAQPDDVVVIAGKGHETGQDVGGVVSPFDDRLVAMEVLRDLLGESR